MKKPALFLFTIPGRGRAVLFPVAVRKNNTVVFATCSHTVYGLDRYKMVICDQDGRELPAQKAPEQTLIVPPALGADLAFVMVPMDAIPSIVRLSDRPITKGQTLNHARNVMFRSDFKEQAHVVSAQVVAPLTRRFARVDGSYYEPAEHIAELGRTLKNPFRTIAMRSWPGVSGSPLWDQYGNVLGMVGGGNEELTESEPDYYLVYLPSKVIREHLRRFVP